jgi:peptide/nickel transport system permease protein
MSQFIKYLAKRSAQSVFVVFGVSILVFTMTRIIPGDPVRLMLGPQATEEQIARETEALGLNDPIYVQYVDWITGFIQGDWGTSVRTGGNVYDDIARTVPATFELVLVALFIAVALAIPAGVIAGTNQNKIQDHISRLYALFGVSMPRFWIAIMLQVILVVNLDLFPLTGRLSNSIQEPATITHLFLVDSLLTMNFEAFVDALRHIILPAFALGLATFAQVTRLIRSEIIEESRKDYVTAAKAWGLPENILVYKYMLKNAFASSLTIIGLSFGFLMGNAFLVELVFNWPGMARYGVQSILAQDMNAIVGVVVVTGFAFAVANLITDVLYGVLDPRIRSGGER